MLKIYLLILQRHILKQVDFLRFSPVEFCDFSETKFLPKHGVTSQKMSVFINTSVRTSVPASGFFVTIVFQIFYCFFFHFKNLATNNSKTLIANRMPFIVLRHVYTSLKIFQHAKFVSHEQDMIMTAYVICRTFLQNTLNRTFHQQERFSILHIVFLTRLKIKKKID
jgi:hypothetical protein